MRDIPLPPSNATGEMGVWMQSIWRVLSNLPNISYYSGVTPNSIVTGLAGDLLVNVGSSSTDTRAWIKGGSASVPSTSGWITLRTGPA